MKIAIKIHHLGSNRKISADGRKNKTADTMNKNYKNNIKSFKR